MAFSVQDLWFKLLGLGMIEAHQAESWAARTRAAATAAAANPDDPLVIAKILIEQRVLTPFQAKQILSGHGDELVQGDYLILERVKRAPLRRWCRAKHLPTGRLWLVYPCGSSVESRDYVDPQWLLPHAAVSAPGLQSLAWVELDGEAAGHGGVRRGMVLSALPEGQTLTDWLTQPGAVGVDAALAISEVVGGALAAMHRASLFHGGLRPGRIWISGDDSVFVLRCGGGPPIFPSDPVAPGYDWFDDDGQAELYAAPEWRAGQNHADASTDVYSLGALAYHVATGKQPTPGEWPAEIRQAVAAGPLGDPLMRVLAAAMQPDRSLRFTDVDGLLRALQAVRKLSVRQVAPSLESPALVESPAPAASPQPAQTPGESVPPSPLARSGDDRVQPPRQPSANRPAKPQADLPRPEGPGRTGPKAKQVPAVGVVTEVREKPSAGPLKPVGVQVAEAPVASPESADSPGKRPIRRRKRRTRKGPILIGAITSSVLFMLLAVLLARRPDEPPPRPRPTPRPVPSVTQAGGTESSEGSPNRSIAEDRFQLVEDERVLWAPPWTATPSPPSLALAVPGAQAIVSLRPKSLLSTTSGADWRGWFGPDLDPFISDLTRRLGVGVDQIDRLTISLLAGQAGEADVAWAVRLVEPSRLRDLRERWGARAAKTPDGQAIWTSETEPDVTYYVPGGELRDDADVKAFVVGGAEAIRWVAEGGGAPIPLPRALQSAWDRTSDRAEMVVLVSPNFLFADGREVLKRYAPRAIKPLRTVLIPDVLAVTVSIDTQRDFYGEIRLVPGGNTSAAGAIQSLRTLVGTLPEAAESLLLRTEVAASWKPLAIRLPQSLRALGEQTRYGIADSQAVANLYLPTQAAPQLALASLLALSTADGPSTVPAAAPTTATRKSIEELLETTLSISFEQESLEFAVNMIGDEFGGSLDAGQPRPQITILGGDLEKSGITQNQQVRDFRMRDVSLRDVLTRLVLGANPDKTATGPADEKQSLIWVVDPKSTDDKPSLLITTRPEAASKGYALPREFTGDE